MMNAYSKKVLLHAFGNSGRGDDGIGGEFIKICRQLFPNENSNNISFKNSFQLNVEDAVTMSDYDIVIFVDATKTEIDNFTFEKVQAKSQSSYSTHSMSPSGILFLCNELYDMNPETYFLQIKGYNWEMSDELSTHAQANVIQAFHFFQTQLQEWQAKEHRNTLVKNYS